MRSPEQNQRRAEALADEAVNIFRNGQESALETGRAADRLRGVQLGQLAQVYATLATIREQGRNLG